MNYHHHLHYRGFSEFTDFSFLILDNVICPYLVKHFDITVMICHPTEDGSLDALMNAEVDM
jgi:hypothetical protein